MKQLITAFFLLQVFLLQAQNFEDSWTGYFSYVSIKSISEGNDKIFAAAENAIFTYDLSTQEINTISTVNGLSGKSITTAYYSENYGLYIIGYENGLIEIIIDGDENILKVVDIIEKQTIPPNIKNINQFYEYNGNLYISTGYGVSVYDLNALEFGDTYFIGDLGSQINISQTTVLNEYIYAASSTDGVKRALVEDDNIIDYQQWTTIATGGYKGIQTLGNETIIAANNNNISLYSPSSGLNFIETFSSNILDFNTKNDVLTITATNIISAYSVGYNLEASISALLDFNYELQSGYSFNNTFYIGTKEDGLLVAPYGSGQAEQVLPEGPLFNQPFAISAAPNQLWVAFGGFDVFFNPYPLTKRGISNLRNETWTNIDYEELTQTLGVDDVNDLSFVATNPEDPNEVYMSSYQKGLLKIKNQTPTILFNETNSPMDIPGGNVDLGIRLYGSDFDREGNFWLVQSRTNEGLIKISPEGQFQIIDISDIIDGESELALSKVATTREGYVFFGTAESGLVGYDPNSNEFNRIAEDIGSGNLPSINVRALAVDNRNQLWIGTLKGLRVIYSVGNFFEEGADTDASAIIIIQDGVAQELLFEQSITDIEVDGSNNKWVSTATSGVFYFSSNGQETLLRFTADNSPLPSDNVQDIEIDSSTGTVYFSTINGLVAYKGTSTAPQEDLENIYVFPNPVRPEFFGNVTIDGLTAKANVKITDITGNLVFETTSEGGSVQWDTTAFGKYRVASGVYLVLVTSDDNLLTKVAKIMIIR